MVSFLNGLQNIYLKQQFVSVTEQKVNFSWWLSLSRFHFSILKGESNAAVFKFVYQFHLLQIDDRLLGLVPNTLNQNSRNLSISEKIGEKICLFVFWNICGWNVLQNNPGGSWIRYELNNIDYGHLTMEAWWWLSRNSFLYSLIFYMFEFFIIKSLIKLKTKNSIFVKGLPSSSDAVVLKTGIWFFRWYSLFQTFSDKTYYFCTRKMTPKIGLIR